MDKSPNQLLIPSAILAASLIISTIVIANAVVKFKSLDQTVFVTGAARKRIVSDMAEWRVTITREAPTVTDAYNLVAKDTPKVENFMRARGVTPEQMIRSAVDTTALKVQKQGYVSDSGGTVVGYRVFQSVIVRSNDVKKIETLARETAELLLKQGILVESPRPEFYCSSLGDLKQTMLADAAKDAQIRAQKIAESTGSRIGPLRSAKMGALQITPPGSTQVSDSGISDTSSIEKDITAVVNVSFALE